ncbi:MAG TPA: hypothetical protein DCM40_38145, partial [Maribacter sp.]|nr:hypothetical protein [Maribacter sp.]
MALFADQSLNFLSSSTFEVAQYPIKRYTFDNILDIETMFDVRLYDNEPHPSASLLYGNRLTNMVIERPFRFGNLNDYTLPRQLQLDFSTNAAAFTYGMMPFKSAFNNFAAETVCFFLEDETLETIVSPPIKAELLANKPYKMRVYIENNNVMMYDRHSAFGPPCDANDTKRAKPVAGGDDREVLGAVNAEYATHTNQHGHMPFVPPYLDKNAKPYVELTFIPPETRAYNAPEIVNNLTASYQNFSPFLNPDSPDIDVRKLNYSASMGVDASLNFDTIVKLDRDKFFRADPFGTTKASAVSGENRDFANFGFRWVIQPKWETPIHDFSNEATTVQIAHRGDGIDGFITEIKKVKNSPYRERGTWNDYFILNATSSINMVTSSTGMWHQHGKPSTGSAGYNIRIQDECAYGLASAVGFLKEQPRTQLNPRKRKNILRHSTSTRRTIKLGKLAEEKNIKEAVVAIPYYTTKNCKVQFFELNKKHLAKAKRLNNRILDEYISRATTMEDRDDVFALIRDYETRSSISGPRAIDSIAYQLRMMQRYVLPPSFDFVSIEEIEPFMIYFFEFGAKLNTTDLSNVWQNLYPESPESTAQTQYSDPIKFNNPDIVYSSHILDSTILNGFGAAGNHSTYENPREFLENEVRWIVFKCKYRAVTNYQYLVKKSIDPVHHFERFREGGKSAVDVINGNFGFNSRVAFNWPYDY